MSVSGAFRERAAVATRDARLRNTLHLATLGKYDARRASMHGLRNPEELRALAEQIKRHTLENLPEYLEQFVGNVHAAGGEAHLARTTADARRIVGDIARRYGLRRAVKAKSMTTEEVELNAALEAAGIRVTETDLGEFIVQIDHDRPSHIVTPIIHKTRQDVARAMQRTLGGEYTDDPTQLTLLARKHLRAIFRECDLGVSGVNFGIAETGAICLCTNEGNGRLTTTRPRVHVALMGVEKLIPRTRDLSVFLKLLARGSTGQPMTVYTTLIHGPRRAAEVDGPEKLHVVLLDAGRSDLLGGPFEEALRCIRCGACLNACPVYRSVGGHAYNAVYGGPIGSVITPALLRSPAHEALPAASSLCGACVDACPVRIDIPELLVRLRTRSRRRQPLAKRVALRMWRWGMERVWLYRLGLRAHRWLLRSRRGPWLVGPLRAWYACREMPEMPADSFRERWARELRDE